MVERPPFGLQHWEHAKVSHGDSLASARVAPGRALIQGGSPINSARDLPPNEADRTSPEKLSSLAALPDFVSIMPVQLPFPPLLPRAPKRSASADSKGLGSPGSAAGAERSMNPHRKSLGEKKIQLSCKSWLQTPASRRLFTGGSPKRCSVPPQCMFGKDSPHFYCHHGHIDESQLI